MGHGTPRCGTKKSVSSQHVANADREQCKEFATIHQENPEEGYRTYKKRHHPYQEEGSYSYQEEGSYSYQAYSYEEIDSTTPTRDDSSTKWSSDGRHGTDDAYQLVNKKFNWINKRYKNPVSTPVLRCPSPIARTSALCFNFLIF
jgi:hypothetical protein